jgi:hypothetical protein
LQGGWPVESVHAQDGDQVRIGENQQHSLLRLKHVPTTRAKANVRFGSCARVLPPGALSRSPAGIGRAGPSPAAPSTMPPARFLKERGCASHIGGNAAQLISALGIDMRANVGKTAQ